MKFRLAEDSRQQLRDSGNKRTPSCVEALGALNRWPGRSGLPIGDYFREWLASCAELQASPELPSHLREVLGIA